VVGEQRELGTKARYWLSAGWRAQPDFAGELVHFHRDGSIKVSLARKSAKRKVSASNGTASRTQPEVRIKRPVELIPTGEVRRATVMYEWQAAGTVGIVNDRLEMPALEGRPGIYRFAIAEANGSTCFYVGETDNLSRRMSHYRNPGPSQQTNVRLHARLQKVLAQGGRVEMSVVVAALCTGEALDLSHRPARLLIENAELCELRGRGQAIENL
jgi:hypothetical protein